MGRKKLVCNPEANKSLRQKLEVLNTHNLIGDVDHISSVKDIYNNQSIKMFFADQELLDTAKAFFDNDLNMTKTAKVMFLHRNTLTYRIAKIKKLLGLDISTFSDALILSNLIYIKDMMDN